MATASILIVEDESIVALDIQSCLKGLGYTPLGIASRGEEAIRKALQLQPDLVLMDIRLKGDMDGVEAAQQIRTLLGTPVVFLTAYADEQTLQRARITGPFGYLIKPFEERELHATIEMALYQHQTEKSLREQAKALEQKNRQLSLANRLLTASTQGVAPKLLLEEACRELSAMLDLPHALVLALNGTGGSVIAYREANQPSSASYALSNDDVRVLKVLVSQKRPVTLTDVHHLARVIPLDQCLRDCGTTSLLLLPLVVNDNVIGCVGLGTAERHSFTEEEVCVGWDVIGQLAGALERIWLTEERQRLSAALEQADTGVIITDVEGAILYVNPAFEHTTGFSRAEALGQTPRILKSDHHEATFYQEMWVTITNNKVWRGHIVNKKKDGSLYTAEASIMPVRHGTGAITSFVSVQRDVTRELEVEDQYHRALKMQAVGRLAAGLAHDFKNLLAAIHGFAQLLQRRGHLSGKPQEWTQGIIDAAAQASELAGQLLTFSRGQPQDLKPLSLNTVLKDVLSIVQGVVTPRVDVVLTPSPGLWEVRADRLQLERVVVNLVANARDAMPDGGRLTMHTANVILRAHDLAFDLEVKPGNYVLLSVSDTGTGMSNDVQAHIFEPFFTTKTAGAGTGLGLATVYGIVKQSGGAIRVRSQPGQGATFDIYLPRLEGSWILHTLKPMNMMPNVPSDAVHVPDLLETRAETTMTFRI